MAVELSFQRFAESLERVGFVDVLLPFLLIFTIIFAVLEKTKIMGEGKRNMNIGLAMVFALIAVIPHVTGNYPAGYDPIQIINASLPSVSLLVVAIISLMILIGVFAHDRVMLGLTAPGWIGLFSILAIVFIFGSAAHWWSSQFFDWIIGMFGNDIIAVVIMILVFGIIVAFVTGGGEGQKIASLENVGIHLGNLFGGKK